MPNIPGFIKNGGGDPLMWEHLETFLKECSSLGIETGLVSAYFQHEAYAEMLNNYLTWSRMSITDKHIDVNRLINDMPNVDIGFSYVVRDECWDYLDDIVELSETSNNVTHIRFTHDIMDESNWDLMDTFKDKYKTKTKCIFQSRNNFTKGMNVCYISKLKPLVDPTGSVYPCCGVQYANVNNDSKDLTSDFKMCNWRDFHNTKEFNGSKCSRCFYNDYNRIFNIINDDNVNHLSFV